MSGASGLGNLTLITWRKLLGFPPRSLSKPSQGEGRGDVVLLGTQQGILPGTGPGSRWQAQLQPFLTPLFPIMAGNSLDGWWNGRIGVNQSTAVHWYVHSPNFSGSTVLSLNALYYRAIEERVALRCWVSIPTASHFFLSRSVLKSGNMDLRRNDND